MQRNFSIFIFVVVIIAVAGYMFYVDSEPDKNQEVRRIVVLVASDLQLSTVEGIRNGLDGLGYSEDVDYVLEINNPKGDKSQTSILAAEIVASKPDLIIPVSTTATKAIQTANEDIELPVVFVDVGNFKALGIEDLKNPGNNRTGVVTDNIGSGGKRIAILKQTVPNARIFSVIYNPRSGNYLAARENYNDSAAQLGITIKEFFASTKTELDNVLVALINSQTDGFLTFPDSVISGNSEQIATALRDAKIPSIDFNFERGAKSGFMLVLGTTRFDVGVQGSRLIDKALRGENLGSIPIEFARNPVLEFNKTTAETLGIVLPEEILLQVTKTYE